MVTRFVITNLYINPFPVIIMASYENFYGGGSYPLSKDYGDSFLNVEVKYPTSTFGIPSDPRSANQIKAVSDKLSTGAKTIEVSGVQAAQWEMVPEQHLEEINRLKKLAGTDLTFHGPVVEPTGISGPGWDESQREQSQRQMWSAVDRAHKMDPKGNLVTTFHASAVNIEPEVKVLNQKTGKWDIKEIYAVDEGTGEFQKFKLTEDHLTGSKKTPEQELKKKNEAAWFRSLQHTSFNANNGQKSVESVFSAFEKNLIKDKNGNNISEKGLQELYGLYTEGKHEEIMKNVSPATSSVLNNLLQEVTHGDIYLRDAYQDLQTLYNEAYDSAKRDNRVNDLKQLDKFKQEIAPMVNKLENPKNILKFGNEIVNGVNTLRKIAPPQKFKPLKPFMIDKSAKTFGNIAFDSYKKFKDTSPIISIENPPAGMGINRAEELKDMVKESKKVFVNRAVNELGLSKTQAEKQAEKLIGVTWDVGHINMIRKFGATEKHLLEETKKIAPYVKHIHLSDNFGMEHTELPMGMGNVPIKKEMEILEKYGKKVKQMKKIAETGNWFGPQAFGNRTPFMETLGAFGSPIYPMKTSQTWNQYDTGGSGYFSGRGMNPDVHHTYFGAGYTELPIELGGQMAGKSRLSGTPTQ